MNCGVCGTVIAGIHTPTGAPLCPVCIAQITQLTKPALTVRLPQEPEAEVVAEPITGWRCWDIDLGPKLQSIASSHNWSAVEEAICTRHNGGGLPDHFGEAGVVPGFHCTCGMWAYQDRQQVQLAKWIVERDGPRAWGSVKLWGRIVTHTYGYRAQYAKPDRIHVVGIDEQQAERLAASYDCTVIRHEEVPGVYYTRAGYETAEQVAALKTAFAGGVQWAPVKGAAIQFTFSPEERSWFHSPAVNYPRLVLCLLLVANAIASLALPGTQWGNMAMTWLLFYLWLCIGPWKTLRKMVWAPPLALWTAAVAPFSLLYVRAERSLLKGHLRRLWSWWRRGGE